MKQLLLAFFILAQGSFTFAHDYCEKEIKEKLLTSDIRATSPGKRVCRISNYERFSENGLTFKVRADVVCIVDVNGANSYSPVTYEVYVNLGSTCASSVTSVKKLN